MVILVLQLVIRLLSLHCRSQQAITDRLRSHFSVSFVCVLNWLGFSACLTSTPPPNFGETGTTHLREKKLHKFGTSWRSPCYRLEYTSQEWRFIHAKSGSILLVLFIAENNILTSTFAQAKLLFENGLLYSRIIIGVSLFVYGIICPHRRKMGLVELCIHM